MTKMRNKIRQEKGNTILEVLLALLIAVLCITFMTNSIVRAGEVNQKNRKFNGGFSYSSAVPIESTGEFSYGSDYSREKIKVKVFENNGYYFAKTGE